MPMALGHEAAGVVEALGEGVEDLALGDHVVLVFMPSCGHCGPCAEGRPALCEPGAAANQKGELIGGGTRIRQGGVPLHHHLGCSSFATYAVVSRRSVIRIDRAIPFSIAALFGCAVLTGVGAVINSARVSAGQSVAIVGLGGVGLAALLGAVGAGANPIIVVDPNPDKLKLGLELGAKLAIDSRARDAVDQIRMATDGGVDIALEFAGVVAALESAYAMTRRGGTTVTAGLPGKDASAAINVVSLVGEERTLKGSYIGTCVPSRDLPRFVALYRAGRLPVDRLLSDTIRLEDINDGFDLLRTGASSRVVIEIDD
jgi:alcohol dehydrogenase